MKGRRNYYRCPDCHAILVTLDVDEGTTPLTLPCELTPGCGGRLVSAGYPEQWPPGIPDAVQGEWYRPSMVQREMMRRRFPRLFAHCSRGGLILRQVKGVVQ